MKVELAAELVRRSGAAEPLWLDQALSGSARPDDPAFRAVYASVSRRLGARAQETVTPSPAGADTRAHWVLADWLRLALLGRGLARTPPGDQTSAVLRLFEGGEIGEQESLVRTLALLPEPERFVDIGLAACRTHALRVFSAAVCENPYPARFFPEAAFNQMVLKAIFTEVSVQRIEGLRERTTPELRRMVQGYASERRAGGRVVPADVDYVLGAQP
jgi:hypothetical protein